MRTFKVTGSSPRTAEERGNKEGGGRERFQYFQICIFILGSFVTYSVLFSITIIRFTVGMSSQLAVLWSQMPLLLISSVKSLYQVTSQWPFPSGHPVFAVVSSSCVCLLWSVLLLSCSYTEPSFPSGLMLRHRALPVYALSF